MADPQLAALGQLAAACRYSPRKWAYAAFPWGQPGTPLEKQSVRRWQDDILDQIEQHLEDPAKRYSPCQIAVASGHGIGKSALMGIITNWAMSCYVEAKVVVTASSGRQLATKTGPEISSWFQRSVSRPLFDVQAQSIKVRDPRYVDTWRLDYITWSVHRTEAFQGLHNFGRIIVLCMDEASGIADIVHEVAEGALTDENTIIIWLMFGNPTQATGRFREAFRRYKQLWYTHHVDSRTVEGTNKKLFERWAQTYGEDSDFFKVRVKGEFPSTSLRQFIDGHLLDEATKRHLRKDQYDFAPVIIGVDPAWTGEDLFVVRMRQGLYTKLLGAWPKNTNDILMAERIARFEDELQADAVFIDGGFGTGIVSAGQSWGRSWDLVWFSEKSADPGCVNKRAEMWDAVNTWLRQGGAIDPKDHDLIDELREPEIVPRPDGKKQLESKEDMKDRGLPSPNHADAFVLTFARPVVKKDRSQRAPTVDDYHGGRHEQNAVVEYDVYEGY